MKKYWNPITDIFKKTKLNYFFTNFKSEVTFDGTNRLTHWKIGAYLTQGEIDSNRIRRDVIVAFARFWFISDFEEIVI